ncbi:hypothetical protein [Burkholderia sp. HI2500]|uniref:hypothetical protein n=1 Tax=Burkholderia sp. HI2500 TaxID=2015358 RepID=UPI001181402B|nr:hypothetical protein [Burkholderia sp. HI2500]
MKISGAEIVSYLGEDRKLIGERLLGKVSSFEVEENKGREYINLKKLGVVLALSGDGVVKKLTGVRFHRNHPFLQGFSPYLGDLPFGISFDMTLDDLSGALGQPNAVDKDGNVLVSAAWSKDGVDIFAYFDDETEEIHTFGFYRE